MTVLQHILSGQNGAIVKQLAAQFGLDGQQAESAIGQLVPALTRGIKNNAAQESGLQSLLGALQQGNHARYVEQPQSLADTSTTLDGNNILGHIFGSKEVSRNVASHAAEQTGVGSSILKQMLPVLATTVMGILGQQGASSNNASPLQGLLQAATGGSSAQKSSGMMGMLTNFLDADKDGSALDDILSMITKKAS